MNVWWIYCLLCSCSVFCDGLPYQNSSKNCMIPKMTLGVLPGRGWDSLQSKEMSQVIQLTYKDCKSSKLSRDLIPDHISIITPAKDEDMQLTTELFRHYLNYTGVTLRGFKTAMAFPFLRGTTQIAGAFSSDSENFKNFIIADKAVATRVHIRSTTYSTVVEPAAELEPAFKSRIFKAAADLENGDKNEDVRYEMEMIVRDYGTHYQTQVDAGAMLVKEDFIKAGFLKENWSEDTQIKAAATAKFVERFGFGFTYERKVNNKIAEEYDANLISSSLRAIGGPVVQQHMVLNDWVSKVPDNLAVIDRKGEPLYFVVNERHFPNISRYTLRDLRTIMEDTIAAYYAHNTRKGCVNTDSPYFDLSANADAQSCEMPITNYTFGGLYTNCRTITKGGMNICAQLQQINPVTGNFSCPSGFQAIPLNSRQRLSNKEDAISNEECTGWWIFSKCHRETTTYGVDMNVKYDVFWCAPITPSSSRNENGLLFGGLFSSSAPNPLTKSASCPSFFQSLSVGPDLKVCISKDFTSGVKGSVPFGGFFTCQSGNPFSLVTSGRSSSNQSRPYYKNPYLYPHNCPSGYTQLMATTDGGCDINYCMAAAGDFAFAADAFSLVRPPFKENFDNFLAFRTLYIEVSSYWPPALLYGGAGSSVGFCLVFIVRGLCKCMKNTKTADTNEENPPNSCQTNNDVELVPTWVPS